MVIRIDPHRRGIGHFRRYRRGTAIGEVGLPEHQHCGGTVHQRRHRSKLQNPVVVGIRHPDLVAAIDENA